jgi:hypothetical protein
MDLRIGGKDGSLVLRSDPDCSPYVGYVEVSIGDELAVRRDVQQHYASGFSDLARFFESLAADWRGWSGERTWESLEGELAFTATHDGHVRLRIDVRGSIERDWRVRCDLAVEPGEQLSAAARDARAFASQYSKS